MDKKSGDFGLLEIGIILLVLWGIVSFVKEYFVFVLGITVIGIFIYVFTRDKLDKTSETSNSDYEVRQGDRQLTLCRIHPIMMKVKLQVVVNSMTFNAWLIYLLNRLKLFKSPIILRRLTADMMTACE